MPAKPGKYPLQKHRCWRKYGGLDREPLGYFKWMHDRVKKGKVKDISWPRTRNGYIMFLAEIGEIPDSIERPTVGRRDHTRGYIIGNVQWEEAVINYSKQHRVNTSVEDRIPW